MSRRIDVELTSSRDDGTWTWRAAGAKQPKGVVDAGLVPGGAQVGDVLKVDAEFEIDGIVITAVIPSQKQRAERERLEIVGPPKTDEPGVITSWVPREERGRRGEGERRGPPRDRRPDAGRDRRPESGARQQGERPRPGGAPGRPGEQRRGPERRPGGGRPAEPRDGERSGRAPGTGTGAAPERHRSERPPRAREASRGGPRPRPASESQAAPPKPKPKRLNPATTHRDAVVATLSPEERPVAEAVLRGGIPAVRNAVEAQNATRPEGQPAIRPEPLVALAEQLLPRLKAAEWRDRAEAANAMVDDITIRDLRSVVAGADAAARDDETRLLASQLRQALDRRLREQSETWTAEITKSLEEQRLVRALRISSRPPDPGTRVPAELAVRLSEAAGTAMAPDVSAERWAALLEAVAASPVRRTVKPAGLPTERTEPLLQLCQQTAGRVPAVAALLGIGMPPPPGPRRLPPKPPRPRPPVPATAPATADPSATARAEVAPSAEPAQAEATEPESAQPAAAEPEQPQPEPAQPEAAQPAAAEPEQPQPEAAHSEEPGGPPSAGPPEGEAEPEQ